MSNPAPSSMSGAMLPCTTTLPAVGLNTPEITFKSVDLPEPFSPMIPWNSPLCTVRETSRSA